LERWPWSYNCYRFRRFLREAVCGLFEVLLITVSVPLAEPAEDG
jgi:hypothetical protein